MKKLSVVIPVHNALPSLQKTLRSLIHSTDNLYELVIVDDFSDSPTKEYLNALRIDPTFKVRLTKTFNPTHSWTNASWNIGVRLATGDFIAVLNSDITLSPHWDSELIKLLDKKHCTIACPVEKRGEFDIMLDPLIERVDPRMIKGACFMFRRQDIRNLFPIPDYLTHWYGDRLLADRANCKKGVAFSAHAIITHQISQSGKTVSPDVYYRTIYQDLLNYEKNFNKDESLIKRSLEKEISTILPNFDYSVFDK